MASKIIVGAHPWAYAARREKNDVYGILDKIFDDFSFAGFAGIELMHTAFCPDDAVSKIADLSDKNNLPVIGSSFGGNMWDRSAHEEILRDAEVVANGLGRVGGEMLGVSTGAKPTGQKTPNELDAQAELLEKIGQICGQNGVTLNLHNHTYEVENSEYEVSEMITRLPDVKLGPDLDWLSRAGVDPHDFLRRHGDRIVFLHLRDNEGGHWAESLGEGEVDYAVLAQVLSEIGFSGPAVVELAHTRDFTFTRSLRRSFKMSRDHIREEMGI